MQQWWRGVCDVEKIRCGKMVVFDQTIIHWCYNSFSWCFFSLITVSLIVDVEVSLLPLFWLWVWGRGWRFFLVFFVLIIIFLIVDVEVSLLLHFSLWVWWWGWRFFRRVSCADHCPFNWWESFSILFSFSHRWFIGACKDNQLFEKE